MIVIGITGTIGAGKGTVVDYLVKNYGFQHYSVREFITEEIKHRGLPVNRDTMTQVSNDLRSQHGASYTVDELYRRAVSSGQDSIIESVRTLGEVEVLRKHGAALLAVDADTRLRYERVSKRASETDRISYEKFLSDEARESTSSNPAEQNLPECIKQADFLLTNNGSIEDLSRQVDEAINKITTR